MKTSNKINALDESLRIAWLESTQESDINVNERDLSLILKGVYKSSMPQAKKQLLLDKLFSTMNAMSFGQLITESLQARSLTEENIALQSKLPVNVIDDIKSDSIFPNNIPVLLIKNLLQTLGISFQLAEEAIWKTFELIKNRSFISKNGLLSTQPSFRHNEGSSRESFLKINGLSDGRELFENEDSLKKYLNKLEGLMINKNIDNGSTII